MKALLGLHIGEDGQYHLGEHQVAIAPLDLYTKRSGREVLSFKYSYRKSPEFSYNEDGVAGIRYYVMFDDEGIRTYLRVLKSSGTIPLPPIDRHGTAKVLTTLSPIIDELFELDPLLYAKFRRICDEAKGTTNSVKNSVIFNKTFADVRTVSELAAILSAAYLKVQNGYGMYEVTFWESQPCYIDQRRSALKSTASRAFNKMLQETESLDLDQGKYPRTHSAISEGHVPITTFFHKREQYFLVNDIWSLWEEMLSRHYEETIALAKAAARRTTYEKDLMSYFYFVLYDLPNYLQSQTGHTWVCTPKLIDSPSELDPPSADGTITRSRSALTPVADNEAHTVVVPYASLGMPGRQTTYCYSHTYSVLRRGFNYKGNVAMTDIEEKLNGRDDYGLMFYTLTGSAQGRGYPTFLIIFERRATGTFVHFHRTHPCRSKDGDENPVHQWVKVCYNWMVGNVHHGRIVAQQGDLAFVTSDKAMGGSPLEVNGYDNHEFDSPVDFQGYDGKENILGYAHLRGNNWLRHHEHEHVLIPEGTYEIRQARSWEANPKGVWSLRID